MTPVEPASASALVGAWVHAHEQDGAEVEVFLPAERDLPPSRGRVGFTLGADGTATAGLPGPGDAGTTTATGTWELDGDVLEVRCPGWAAAYRVRSAQPDRLELSPVLDR